MGANGSVYVVDTTDRKIRQISPAGVVTTLAGAGTAGSAGRHDLVREIHAEHGGFQRHAGRRPRAHAQLAVPGTFRSKVDGLIVEMEQQAIRLVDIAHGDRS